MLACVDACKILVGGGSWIALNVKHAWWVGESGSILYHGGLLKSYGYGEGVGELELIKTNQVSGYTGATVVTFWGLN